MKKMMTLILPLLALTFSAHAAEKKEKSFECFREARAVLQKETGVRPSQIKFWQGAQLGDGAASLEILLYLVRIDDSEAAYKVEYYVEGCDQLLSLDRID